MAERARWLERDLPHLFDDVGIDKSGYAEVVEFRDPITSVRFFQELLFFLPPLGVIWGVLNSSHTRFPEKREKTSKK
jgi:hypothetical protein